MQLSPEKITAARQSVIAKGIEILTSNLTVGTWGNISCRVPESNCLAITPSGMDYKSLLPEDIVILDYRGRVISGERKPSVEVPLHLAVYQARDDVQAVIHTHSVYASALAVARKEIPAVVEDLVQIVGGNVRVNEYALPGTEELGLNTVKALADRNAVLLANHGMLGVGRDLDEALKVCQIVEKSAQIVIFAQLLGGAVMLSPDDVAGMRDFYLHAYGQK